VLQLLIHMEVKYMCMICKGLKRNKFSPEEAKEKLEEFVDLELLDEDHQEEVEALIAEAEDEEYYWASAQKNMRRYEEYEEDEEEGSSVEEEYLDRGDSSEKEPYDES